jgi:pimeloyl-ACP methyl ester carboxylesterase
MTSEIRRPPVLFVHGLFLSPRTWNGWVERYAQHGYTCSAPPWPGRSERVEAARRFPDPLLPELTFEKVLASYVRSAEEMLEKPLVIGHSMGGLIAQLLVARGLAVAAVAIDSVPPQGICATEPSFFISNWAALNPFNAGSHAYALPFETFQYAFANDMPLEEQRRAYDEQVVLESLNVARGAQTRSAQIDFHQAHAPLLFIAGENDHTVPPGVNHRNYERYRHGSASIADYLLFGARNHYEIVCGHDWQLVADAALSWAERRIEELTPPAP